MRRGQHERYGRDPRPGAALARGWGGCCAGNRGQHLGFLTPAGRRQARSLRFGSLCRLGIGRLRRGRGRDRGARSDPRRQASPVGFRHHQRRGLGSRSRLRRQDPDLCRACRMKGRVLDAVIAAGRESRSVALATDLATGRQLLVDGGSTEGELELATAALDTVRGAMRSDRNTTLETPSGRVFVEVFSPPRRCFVVGAVHIAQPLVQMLKLADFGVTVIDPRGSFATEARFPGVELTQEWPDEALERLKPDHRSAVVTLTHDPKLDDPALAVALRSECFYIGALGSRRTHAARCQRLTEMGFTEAELTRIHGPIGLSIGAVSPAEIAVSILGQMTQILRRGERAEA